MAKFKRKAGAIYLYDDLYRVHYWILTCEHTALRKFCTAVPPCVAEAMETGGHFNDLEGQGGFFSSVGTNNGLVGLIWINTTQARKNQRHVVVHEALHGTIAILKSAGMTLSEESEEAYTDYHSWLTQQIWDRLGLA